MPSLIASRSSLAPYATAARTVTVRMSLTTVHTTEGILRGTLRRRRGGGDEGRQRGANHSTCFFSRLESVQKGFVLSVLFLLTLTLLTSSRLQFTTTVTSSVSTTL